MRTGRYTISSSTKLLPIAARGNVDEPPIFNLVEVEPVGQSASLGTGDRFATGVLAGFDVVQCQVAYVSGNDARLTEVASDATRDAIRSGGLRLTGCAFQADDVQCTLHQLGRVHKYVERGFRLPAGPLPAAPVELLRDEAPSTALINGALLDLLKGRLHWEPSTPPRIATPARRPPFPLLLKFARADAGAWRVVPPRSSAAQQQLASAATECAAPMAGLSHRLRSNPEALAVWTFVMKLKAAVERTRQDARARVPQYKEWRLLVQLRRSGKGIDRVDVYVFPPDVLPDVPLHALRPTNRAVRSFRGLHSLLMQRFATTASGGVVAAGAAGTTASGGVVAAGAVRSSRRCPASCTLPCCQRTSASVEHSAASESRVRNSESRAAPPLPVKKRYRAWPCAPDAASDDTPARPLAAGGPIEMPGMWENVVRVNGVVRDDLEMAITRHTRLRGREELDAHRARLEQAAKAADEAVDVTLLVETLRGLLAPDERELLGLDHDNVTRAVRLEEGEGGDSDSADALGCRPIRVCGDEEEATDMGHVAGEDQSW